MFDAVDIDGDGLLDFDEFKIGLTDQEALVSNKRNMKAMFDKIDLSGDGKLDLIEIKEAFGGGDIPPVVGVIF